MKTHKLYEVCPFCSLNNCKEGVKVSKVLCNDNCKHETHVEVLAECDCECEANKPVLAYKSEESKYSKVGKNDKALWVGLGVVAAATIVGGVVWLATRTDDLWIDELE